MANVNMNHSSAESSEEDFIFSCSESDFVAEEETEINAHEQAESWDIQPYRFEPPAKEKKSNDASVSEHRENPPQAVAMDVGRLQNTEW